MMLYLDCVGGVAGDMLLASLIDAGASLDSINSELAKLGVPGLLVNTARVTRHSIDCCHVTVNWEGSAATSPNAVGDNDGHPHKYPHRSYADIRCLIADAGLAPRVAQRALAAFRLLAEAEGRMHSTPPDDVHFHEVGSEDSIADVVAVAIALELLGVAEVRCSPLPLGRGLVKSAHGILPLPAPATLELLRGVPTVGVDIEKELVTPTGAALVVSLATGDGEFCGFGGFPSMTPLAIGYGAGGRDLPQRPNIVRALLGVTPSAEAGRALVNRPLPTAQVVVIETNLDDCSPELVPDAAAAAIRAGALDVWTTPVMMKKGRPGFIISALTRPENASAVAQALLAETSALGVRMSTYDRIELDRSFTEVTVDGCTVSVKLGLRSDGTVVNVAPEHDDCAAAAATLKRPVKEVYARALAAALAAHHN